MENKKNLIFPTEKLWKKIFRIQCELKVQISANKKFLR